MATLKKLIQLRIKMGSSISLFQLMGHTLQLSLKTGSWREQTEKEIALCSNNTTALCEYSALSGWDIDAESPDEVDRKFMPHPSSICQCLMDIYTGIDTDTTAPECSPTAVLIREGSLGGWSPGDEEEAPAAPGAPRGGPPPPRPAPPSRPPPPGSSPAQPRKQAPKVSPNASKVITSPACPSQPNPF